VLGPLEIVVDGQAVAVGGVRRRTLLGVLLVHRDNVVSVDRLVDELWQDDAPAQSRDTLQAHLAHLRRALAGVRPEVVIERKAPGYVLRAPDDCLDVTGFERLVEKGRIQLAAGDVGGGAASLSSALESWARPFDGVDDAPSIQAERGRLDQIRRDAIEEWANAELRLGRVAAVIPSLEALLVDDPWRERATGQLMTALYRAGRQVDALATYERLRRTLADELGLVPSPELRALEGEILRQAATLDPGDGAGGGAAGGAAPDLGRVLPFTGRDAELNVLLTTLRRATQAGRAVAMVRGEAGAGKTRLVRELALAAAAQGVTVLAGRCDEDPLAPYGPFLEAISGYIDRSGTDALAGVSPSDLAELSRVVPRLASQLPTPAPAGGGSPEFERLRFFEAIDVFLRAVAPALLVLDDVHWADPGSLMLLRHVLRSAETTPLLVVATTRDAEPGTPAAMAALADAAMASGGAVYVELTGLDADAVTALVRAAFDDAADRHVGQFATELFEATGGNPFFVRELLRDAAASGTIATLRRDGLPLPPTIRDAIAARTAGMQEAVLDAMRASAIIGEEFDLDVVAAMQPAGEETVLGYVEAALRAGVVVETATVDRFRFAHALVRRFLLDEMSASRRVRLHHLAGTALERLRADALADHFGELAHHFAEAAKVADAGLAVTYAQRAGERAMALFAYEEAVQHFQRAVDGMGFMADPDDAARCELLLQLGDALNRAGDTPEAATALSSAAALARRTGDATRLARAALDYGGHWTQPAGVDAERAELLESALELLEGGDASLRSLVMARLAEALAHGEAARAADLGTEAVATARRTGDDAALAAALYANVTLLFDRGDVGRLAEATELVELAERLGDADLVVRAGAWKLLGLLELGDAEGVEATLHLLVEEATALGQPLYEWGAAGFSAMYALLRGEFDEAESAAQTAMELARRGQAAQAQQNYVAQLIAIRYCQGRLAEIAPVLGALAASPDAIAAWEAVAGWVEFQLGDPVAAQARVARLRADDFAAIASGPFWAPPVALVGEVCAAGGDVDDAAALYRRLLPLADEAVVVGRASVCLGAAGRFLGLLATRLEQWSDAEEHFARALEINQRMGARPFTALTEHAWACMYAARHGKGDDRRAARLAADAQAGAKALGMHWLADLASAMS
jgi:DNA-binding SARP family transcriptional activator